MNAWLALYLTGFVVTGALMAHGVASGQLDWSDDEERYPGLTALATLILSLMWPVILAWVIFAQFRRDD